MERKEFISNLVDLLAQIDMGMAQFNEPLPSDTVEAIKKAIAGFGEEALPKLHHFLQEPQPQADSEHIIDAIGIIKSESSVKYLIEFHRNNASFLSGVAAIQALKNIGTEDIYLYLGELLTQQALGKYSFNTDAEIALACVALGEWGDERAIPFLERSTSIRNLKGMPEIAIQQLANYPQSRQFLLSLAEEDKSLEEYIYKHIKN